MGRMVIDMNASKNKGDYAEREAVEFLKITASDLLMGTARRKLGAGRRDDIGDVDAFDDVTVQVKWFNDTVRAQREALLGARIQSERAGTRWYVGMSPITGARRDRVRWLCVSDEWPSTSRSELPQFGRASAAIAYFRSMNPGIEVPPEQRVALVKLANDLVIMGVATAWVDSLRAARERVSS